MCIPLPLAEIEKYVRTVTSDAFKQQDLFDDVREAMEEVGMYDPDRLGEILGHGRYSQSVKDFAEERGLEEKYT